MKKVLSLIIVIVMTCSVIGVIQAKAATNKTTDISWYATQNQQPWPGSQWTFEYLDKASMEFIQMETYVDAKPSYWQDISGKVQIKSWQQVSTYDKYASVAFHATERGKVSLTSTSGTIQAGSVGGQFMLLQKSGTQYHALLEWIDIPANQSVKIPQVETFVETDDTIYFLYRSANVLYVTSQVIVNYIPKAIYTTGIADTGNLYPTEWTDLSTAVIGSQEELDAALNAAPITYNPTDAKYQDGNRLYQGVPSIVKEDKPGRLWATWMTGGFSEDEYNWAPIYTSDDDGQTWSGPKFVIDPETPIRAFE